MAGMALGSVRVFLSYRREDSISHVNGLFHHLRDSFGDEGVFKDTDDIGPGQDFVETIKDQLRSCSVLLAVMGRQWLTARSPKTNARRLDDPGDYVRLEVATAIRDPSVLVIPILVGGATMPSKEDLPPDLAQLCHRQAEALRDSRWESDVAQLIQTIKITQLLKKANEAFTASDLLVVKQACDEVLLLDPKHAAARDLRERSVVADLAALMRRESESISTPEMLDLRRKMQELIAKNLRA